MEPKEKRISFERFRRIGASPEPQDPLLEDIRGVCRQIDAAYTRFALEEDDDLLDAAIYELEALKARYRYLIKKAKRQKLASSDIGAVRYERRDLG